MSSSAIAALDVGGTHVSGALVDAHAWEVIPDTWHHIPIDSSGSAETILAAFATCVNTLLDSWTGPMQSTLGVAMPSPFDFDTGISLMTGSNGKYQSLYGINVGTELINRVAPIDTVRFVNDAAAYTIGEWVAGAAVGKKRVVGITLGTGIGSAFLDDGRIIDSGDAVPEDGEIYLTQINDRPIEDTVSRRAVRAQYAQLSGSTEELDVREIAALVRGGDSVAADVFAHAYTELGKALKPWVASFEADIVVVGGAISGSFDLIAPHMREGLGEFGSLLALSPLQSDAAMIGAAHTALH